MTKQSLLRIPDRWGWRIALLVSVLTIELIVTTTRHQVSPLFLPRLDPPVTWVAELFHFSKEIWRAGLWVAGACLLLLSPQLRTFFGELRHHSKAHPWRVWLFLHILAFAAFLGLTAYIFSTPTDPVKISPLSFSAWFSLGGTALLLWLLAVGPVGFWRQFLRRQCLTILLGFLLGCGAWAVLGMLVRQEAPLAQQALWSTLAEATLQLVYGILQAIYSDLAYDPQRFLVGTSTFPVEVTYACSGIEGISLISLFLSIYLWLFRSELRFPQAFWLFPIAIIGIWLANAFRIVALIVIGTSFSEQVALAGFHAQAGWIAFNVIAVGAIFLMHKNRYFSAVYPYAEAAKNTHMLASALLVPFFALMATSMLTSAVTGDFDAFYLLRVLITGATLWYFRNHYCALRWTVSGQALLIGIAVFALWMFLEPEVDDTAAKMPHAIEELPDWAAAVWLGFRVLGSVVIVPLAEELAFRGYLLRKLVAENFEDVSFKHLTWRSLVVSSVLFGLLHQRWLAGTLAGMAYAAAAYRHGRLGDAVLAHVTSNALIAFWVLSQGQWSLWS